MSVLWNFIIEFLAYKNHTELNFQNLDPKITFSTQVQDSFRFFQVSTIRVINEKMITIIIIINMQIANYNATKTFRNITKLA